MFGRISALIPAFSWSNPTKKATQKDGFFVYRKISYYPFSASAPPTISRISLVMEAWRALL